MRPPLPPDTQPQPPDDPVVLYLGEVMHARLKPMGHRFAYRVMSMLIDLDRLAEADGLTRLFGVNRSRAFAFHERDHGPRDGTSLRRHVDRVLLAANVDLAGGRVALLAYPRIFGYVFNPLAIYYCYARDGRLAALIYEVRNTFGEMHSYVCPVAPGDVSVAGIRQGRDKAFYVSPFIAMTMRYHFRMSPPGENVKVRILESDSDGPLLAATFHGRRHAVTTGRLAAILLRLPFMTLKIIAAIHFEAFRLWLKGARPQPRPSGSNREADAAGAPQATPQGARHA